MEKKTLEELSKDLEERDRKRKEQLIGDAKKGKYDIITQKLLDHLGQAKQKREGATSHIDTLIQRTKKMDFHDGVEPLALSDLMAAITINSAVPDYFAHIQEAILEGDYDDYSDPL